MKKKKILRTPKYYTIENISCSCGEKIFNDEKDDEKVKIRALLHVQFDHDEFGAIMKSKKRIIN